MRAKVTELSNKLYWIQDENTPIEHIEAFNNCTTTLSELKEMWENEKIWKEVDIKNEFIRDAVFEALKNSPRKFTIEQVIQLISDIYDSKCGETRHQVINHLTSLPPNGIEVEIEGNKIVKVYV